MNRAKTHSALKSIAVTLAFAIQSAQAQIPSKPTGKPSSEVRCELVPRVAPFGSPVADVERLKKMDRNEEALRAMPPDQRVMPPRDVICDGIAYLDLDMYGTRFRIPKVYLGQGGTDGYFVDGYFAWPEKWATRDPRNAEAHKQAVIDLRNTTKDDVDISYQLKSREIKFWIKAIEVPLSGKRLEKFRQTAQAGFSLPPKATPSIVRELSNGTQEYFAQGGVPNNYFVRQAKDIRSPIGDELWLRRFTVAPNGRPYDTFVVYFPYNNVEFAYLLARKHVQDWPAIHTEMMKLLSQWKRDN